MAVVYLAFGSNLGNRKQYILQAVEELKHAGVRVVKLSTIIETAPVGGPGGQRDFLNAVAQAETALKPEELLAVTSQIENELGRKRSVKDGPRTIDIDILLYNDITVNTDKLIIPHPRMWEREFVVKPLKEIAPHLSP